jgi:tetratricopeptide (TPR) repeat protein
MDVSPLAFAPLGADADFFSLGAGAETAVSWKIAPIQPLSAGIEAGYLFLPSLAPDSTVSATHAAVAAAWGYQFAPKLWARAFGQAGWFFAALNSGGAPPGSNPYLSGGLSLGLDLTRNLGLGLDAGYRSYAGLASGLSVGLSLSLRPRGAAASGDPGLLVPGIKLLKGDGAGIDPVGIVLETVFPVFYALYDTTPIGKVYLRNLETVDATDISIKVLVKQFMDEAKTSLRIDRLAGGSTAAVDVIGLFSDRLLGTSEGTKVPVSITVEYRQFGKAFKEEFVETLSIGDRNALVWDDDRKAAAFVSSKDPESLRISRVIASSVNDALLPGMNPVLQKAIAVHESMRLLKLNYQSDPSSAIVSGNRTAMDFLQFPQQTLAFRSGDCDDLSILYASLFESMGVPAAFITVPGHILVAVDLGMTRENAAKVFKNPGDLIESGGRIWLPVETTAQDKDFLYAWGEGSRQWRNGQAKNSANLIPIREAWKAYPAVVLPGSPAITALPPEKAILAGFKAETAALVSDEIDVRVAELQAEAKKSNDPSVLNRLGVLFARFGQLDKAELQFNASIKRKETPAALVNLGNLAFARGKFAESVGWYEKALKKTADDPKTMVALARAQAEMGKLDAAKQNFDKASSLDPTVGERFAYLGLPAGDTSRAASAEESRRNLEWTE